MRRIKQGSTDVSVEVFAADAITGQPKTGLVDTDISARYVRTRGLSVAISPAALAGPDAAHSEGGFVEIDATNCPGWYRFDPPDAAFAAGVDSVLVVLLASGALIAPVRVELVSAVAGDLVSELHLCKAALTNKRVHTISTGVDEIKDDDGSATLVTMTPTDGGNDTIVVTPS